jgi:CDP-diglyceride synthetase
LLDDLARMFLTMFSLLAGGVANMIFTKTKLYAKHKRPIDGNKVWIDNKRIFGENKTWIGFVAMILFCSIFQVLCGCICNLCGLNAFNDLYLQQENTILFNLLFGMAIGAVYMLCELPNSFIKRRLDIESGKTARGLKGCVFFIVDQVDSLIGVMLVLHLVSGISVLEYLNYIFLGAVTHVGVNSLLYIIKIRRCI